MGKPRHREVKHLVQGHTASEWGARIEPGLSGFRVCFTRLKLPRQPRQHSRAAGDRPVPGLPGVLAQAMAGVRLNWLVGTHSEEELSRVWKETAFWAYSLNTPLSLTIGTYNHRPTISLSWNLQYQARIIYTDTGTEAQREVTTCLRSPQLLCCTLGA